MAGFTDGAMRRICHQAGAALTYTEMVNAIGLVRGSSKTWHLLTTLPGEGGVVAHLYGAHPTEMADAAVAVWQSGRFVALDINAGCPMKKITANGCGAALMKQPEKIGAMVAAMRAATPLPVTVKTRIGLVPDTILSFEILRAVEEAGAAAITVHGRFAAKFHSGPVAFETLAAIKAAARIPVIGNGGINSSAAADVMLRETGVDGVMVGQGAMGNPWLFSEIAAMMSGGAAEEAGEMERRTVGEICAMFERHVAASLELQELINAAAAEPEQRRDPESVVATGFRCHLFRYFAGVPGAAKLRGEMSTLRSIEAMRAAIARHLKPTNVN
ncbi:MAG: tRNA-dihydrouridine synthase family protein [Lentisphaerae bacterium]|nr:tRNA-dihydrouridine synthase family protein [Lentisphaerota bacterium]